MTSTIITVVGTIASDPRLITTSSGVTLCSFRLASGERRYDRAQQKWIDGETNWFGVTAFRTLAEHAHASFRKGERVFVHGRVRVRQWEKDERSGTAVEIDADALGHDLRWGVSRFEKRVTGSETTKESGNDSGGNAGGNSSGEMGADPGSDYSAGEPFTAVSTSQGEASQDGFTPLAA